MNNEPGYYITTPNPNLPGVTIMAFRRTLESTQAAVAGLRVYNPTVEPTVHVAMPWSSRKRKAC